MKTPSIQLTRLHYPPPGSATKEARLASLMMNLFAIVKIPMLFFARPKVIWIDNRAHMVRIRLRRRTKNHLGSMYFGALCVGVDAAGGFLAAYLIRKSKQPISLVFKDIHGEYLKRPERDVYFLCEDGEAIQQSIEKAISTKERVNNVLSINAYIKHSEGYELVAKFTTTLSIKLRA